MDAPHPQGEWLLEHNQTSEIRRPKVDSQFQGGAMNSPLAYIGGKWQAGFPVFLSA